MPRGLNVYLGDQEIREEARASPEKADQEPQELMIKLLLTILSTLCLFAEALTSNALTLYYNTSCCFLFNSNKIPQCFKTQVIFLLFICPNPIRQQARDLVHYNYF